MAAVLLATSEPLPPMVTPPSALRKSLLPLVCPTTSVPLVSLTLPVIQPPEAWATVPPLTVTLPPMVPLPMSHAPVTLTVLLPPNRPLTASVPAVTFAVPVKALVVPVSVSMFVLDCSRVPGPLIEPAYVMLLVGAYSKMPWSMNVLPLIATGELRVSLAGPVFTAPCSH